MIARLAFLTLIAGSIAAYAAEPAITVATPMPPPEWALLERQLLSANSKAAEKFAARFVDERGYLTGWCWRRVRQVLGITGLPTRGAVPRHRWRHRPALEYSRLEQDA